MDNRKEILSELFDK